jgi:hypothetical protein
LLAVSPLRAYPTVPVLSSGVVASVISMSLPVVSAISTQPPGPTVTAANVTRAGLVMTFNEPMDPATVANVRNYTVQDTTLRPLNAGDLVTGALYQVGIRPTGHRRGPVRLRAADYDPATLSVTLVPVKPLKKGDVYTVNGRTTVETSPHGSSAQPLTDLAGEPLVINLATGRTTTSNGTFTVTVAPPIDHNSVRVHATTVVEVPPGTTLPPGVG